MESNWRLNVERTGNSEFQWWRWNPLSPIYIRITLMAELRTPFTFLGHTYTYIAQAKGFGVTPFWNYLSLLADGRWYSAFTWTPIGRGFPYGADVFPD